jgi:hypothetical protein
MEENISNVRNRVFTEQVSKVVVILEKKMCAWSFKSLKFEVKNDVHYEFIHFYETLIFCFRWIVHLCKVDE